MFVYNHKFVAFGNGYFGSLTALNHSWFVTQNNIKKLKIFYT